MNRHNLQLVAGAFALLLGISATALGGVPPMEVTVFDAGSKVAFRGTTTTDGTFATPKLRPGNYVVQFNTRSAATTGNQYLVVVSAGKRKVVATDVAGKTFTGGGAAMRVAVTSGLQITGQVADAQAMAGGPYRVIGGHRFIWIGAELGTNLRGHWEEATLPPAANIVRVDLEVIRRIQDSGGEGSMITNNMARAVSRTGY